MSKVHADYFPRNISQYVPLMEFAADVINGQCLVNLGAPIAIDLDGIWDGVTADASINTYTSADFKSTFGASNVTGNVGEIDAIYGRALTCTGSTGSDHVLVISGRDYLGQAMSETFTLNGTTPDVGNKAFKFVDTMVIQAGAASDTCDVGWNDKLGVPYAMESMASFREDTVVTSPTVVASVTTTATTSTGDTRGTVIPASSTDGSNVHEAFFNVNTDNMHGVVQA
jgi:hypothetical protein